MVKISKYKKINIEDIDLNKTKFSFSFPEQVDNIAESINKIGLLQPPVIYRDQIVCGRRRIKACKKIGHKETAAGIIENAPSDLSLFELNIYDNISIRELNIIEKSIILNKLHKEFNINDEDIAKRYFSLLKIPVSMRYFNKYIWLCSLSDNLKKDIVERNISLDTICIMKDWPQSVRDETLQLVLSFGFGNNKVNEIVDLLRDISLRDNAPVDAPFRLDAWKKIKDDPRVSYYRKGEWLRGFLTKKRYPIHSEFKDNVKRIISKLDLKDDISFELNNLLSWEDDGINIKAKYKSRKDLEKIIEKLKLLKDSEELCDLLNMLKVPL